MKRPEVTLLTPSLRGRERMLGRTIRSVKRQTVPARHLWRIDRQRLGPAPIRNQLLDVVRTEFAGFVDDDDVLYRQHVEVCLAALWATDACVVYPWFKFAHPRRGWPHGEFLQIQRPDGSKVHAWRQPFDPAALAHNSFIPVTVVARTDCLRTVGGFPTPGTPEWPHESTEELGAVAAAGRRRSHVRARADDHLGVSGAWRQHVGQPDSERCEATVSEDRQLWTYELPDGYRSPYLWASADAATAHAASRDPGITASAVLATEVHDGEPVGKSLRGFAEVSVRAAAVKAWCGPRASGDFMAQEAALRLDAGGIQVDIVGSVPDLRLLRDRIAAAFDRALHPAEVDGA